VSADLRSTPPGLRPPEPLKARFCRYNQKCLRLTEWRGLDAILALVDYGPAPEARGREPLPLLTEQAHARNHQPGDERGPARHKQQ
jgi:hypothetical protein